MTATNEMLDVACDEVTTNKIINSILDIYKDVKIKDIKTRKFGNKCYVDLEIILDGNTILTDVNNIVLKIHDKVEKDCDFIKHCNIRVIPFE